MSHALFDPSAFGGPKTPDAPPRKQPPPFTVMANTGQWRGLARLNTTPASLAHLIKGPQGREGAVVTRCGVLGRTIAIDKGVEINACNRCLKAAGLL